jgi:peptide/nickel transport system substrate-binding protein
VKLLSSKNLLAPLLCASLFATATQAATPPTELKMGIVQEFENLNPIVMTMVATTYIYQMVGRSLVTLNDKGQWVPQLVKTIPSLDNKLAKLSPDKKKIIATWELIDNAKWGDGKDITCEDLAFTREVAINDNVSTPNKENYSDIDSITWDAKTPKKCVFTYKKAEWTFYQLSDFRPIPAHLEREVYEKYKTQKEGYEKNSNYSKNPTLPGLYNGPYRIQEIKLADHVTVIANPYFFGKAPKIQKIQIKLIPNTGTLEANLRSGTIDGVSSLGFAFDQALAFEKKVKAEKLPYDVIFRPSITYEHIDLNLDNPILKDKRVRKALVYSINREELVKALFEGKLQPAVHNVSPIDPWFTKDPKDIVLYPYDRKKAGALLDEAGWKMGADKFRYKDGKKLSLVFMTTAGDKTRENVQVFLQGNWKAVGIDVQIKNEPARVFFGETLRKRNYGAMAMFAWASMPENSPRTNLHTIQIPSEKNGWSGQNGGAYSNPEMDKLLDEMDLEFNAAKRKQLITKILRYYTDDVPVIPLYYRADVAVAPPYLKNMNLTGHQYSESNAVEYWETK